MTPRELQQEIARLRRLIVVAAKKAAARDVVIDKITAALLRVELLLKRMREGK